MTPSEAPARGDAGLAERDARYLARHASEAWFRPDTVRELHAVGALHARGYLDRGADASWRVNTAGRAYLATRGRRFRRTTAAIAQGRADTGAGE